MCRAFTFCRARFLTFLRVFYLFLGGVGWDGWWDFSYRCRFGVGIVLDCPIMVLHISNMSRDVVADSGVFG